MCERERERESERREKFVREGRRAGHASSLETPGRAMVAAVGGVCAAALLYRAGLGDWLARRAVERRLTARLGARTRVRSLKLYAFSGRAELRGLVVDDWVSRSPRASSRPVALTVASPARRRGL